jgi:hypothetical protein
MRWTGRESGREQVLEATHEPEGSHHRSFKVLVVTGISRALNFSKGVSLNAPSEWSAREFPVTSTWEFYSYEEQLATHSSDMLLVW